VPSFFNRWQDRFTQHVVGYRIRHVTFQLAEVALPWGLFATTLERIERLRWLRGDG